MFQLGMGAFLDIGACVAFLLAFLVAPKRITRVVVDEEVDTDDESECDDDPYQFCGNGFVEPGEECDSTDSFCSDDCRCEQAAIPVWLSSYPD